MKKLFLFLTLAIFSLTFTSCSKEDDPKATANEVVGNYTGELSVTITGTEPIINENTITVEKAGDRSINLILKDFTLNMGGDELSIGDIKLSNVTLNGDNEPYTFTASQTIKVDIMGDGKLVDVPVKAETGKFENGKLTTTLSIVVVPGVMDVKVQFEGTKK